MEIKRDIYLQRLIDREWNGAVKVVTGIRRCGKSYLLFKLFKDHLLNDGVDESHIIEMPLDTPKFIRYLSAEPLYDHICELIGSDDRYYVLLDEIQLVDNFESVLNGLLRMGNVDVYVTGSNSRLLSRDVITEFRGRADEVHLRPLSFSEFYSVFDGTVSEAWKEYMTYGGLPEVVNKKGGEQKADYLAFVMDMVYLKDIKERHNIRMPAVMDNLVDVLSSNIGCLSNPTKMKDTLITKGNRAMDDSTVSSYITFLEDAYLFEESKRYDLKGRSYLEHTVKYYSVDPGLRNARLNFRQTEFPHLMENVIFNELRSRGFKVDVGVVDVSERTSDRKVMKKKLEIDFVANKGDKRYYIQSAYAMDDEEKRASEIRPFLKTGDFFKKIVVTGYDAPTHRDDRGILYIGVMDFLLDQDSMDL